MRNKDNFWVYPPKQAGQNYSKCSWCTTKQDSELREIKIYLTSDGTKILLCRRCERLGRLASTGGFNLPRIAVPMIQEKRSKEIP